MAYTEKQIMEFIDELTAYVAAFIVGHDNTIIQDFTYTRQIFERGHGIRTILDFDKAGLTSYAEDQDDDDGMKFGPVFYAEEIMDEFKGASIAAIAETLNARISSMLPEFEKMNRLRYAARHNCLDDYDKDDIIVSSMPIASLIGTDMYDDGPFIKKEINELFLRAYIKGVLMESVINEDQAYFVPISVKDHPATDDDWEKAKRNSLRQSNCKMFMLPIPGCGTILDENRFYDYFYLHSPKEMFDGIAKTYGVKKIYINPIGAHQASFIIELPNTKALSTNSILIRFVEIFVNSRNEMMPIFELDCEKWTFKTAKKIGNTKIPEFKLKKGGQ